MLPSSADGVFLACISDLPLPAAFQGRKHDLEVSI